VTFALPAGTFRVRLYAPATGLYSPASAVEGGKMVWLDLPPSRQEPVIGATRSR
jgi:hypothetical protein